MGLWAVKTRENFLLGLVVESQYILDINNDKKITSFLNTDMS